MLPPNLSHHSFDSMLATSVHEAQTATMLHKTNWRLGEETSWQIDQKNGNLVLLFSNGDVAIAPIQVIGSFHLKENSFLWAWDHPSILPDLQKNAHAVRSFGKMHFAKVLTKNRIPCTEKKAWELAALAMKLNQASGIYRVEVKPYVSLFVNFGEVQLTTAAKKEY
jgi:hypothetical protein